MPSVAFVIVVTSAATRSAAATVTTTTTQHCRRGAVLAAAGLAPCLVALVPCPAAAKLLNPAVTWTQQEQLMRGHAARFEKSTPVAVRTTSIAGRRIREVVATVDLPANIRVAVYPVEMVADTEEHDDTYAVAIYYANGPRGQREAVAGVTGIPTEASLAHAYIGGLPTVGMYANEPEEGDAPNCLFEFPTVGGRVHLGDMQQGYLRTVTSVQRGTSLTWCYGPSEMERGYPTACARN
mmetsp:Transcript_16494/g.33315  ORF Transcript_16494/g.33315 Transcript_16494/m.33315 type:complete len:238 (+) Transcript_16494:57-770(+)|eukprot:CAMPEP_0119074240 /NCGR_PEP_ID=MMETSP1178-20130426/71983_1 /TAXON_ID=33656 /ORGANISM="unid sp, Strain CCMP2000" /LENGTH=237 /DNA_ID=CAMNT_0007056381 /DNA_START=49 /DNA_END=762 /DNA_ORIENTATION=-